MTEQKHPLSDIDFMKPITDDVELTEEQAAQIVAQKHAELKKMTEEVKEELSLLTKDIEKSRQDIERLALLEENKHKGFFSPFFKRKRKPVEVGFLKQDNQSIPVVKKYIDSPHKINDTKSLISFSCDWIKTIFEDKIMVKSLNSTGTVLFILPKGNLRFVQFTHNATPLHVKQTQMQERLTPLKVMVFRNFYDFRSWIYEQMSTL